LLLLFLGGEKAVTPTGNVVPGNVAGLNDNPPSMSRKYPSGKPVKRPSGGMLQVIVIVAGTPFRGPPSGKRRTSISRTPEVLNPDGFFCDPVVAVLVKLMKRLAFQVPVSTMVRGGGPELASVRV